MVTPKLELVVWRDAFVNDEERTPRDYLCKSVGWTKVEGRFLCVQAEKTPDGPRAKTRIPLALVVSRQELGQGGDVHHYKLGVLQDLSG